jgi:hypothetical protein
MGLYAKVLKLRNSREKPPEVNSAIIDFAPCQSLTELDTNSQERFGAFISQITEHIDQEARFIIVGFSLTEVLEGIKSSVQVERKSQVTADVVSLIRKTVLGIAYPFQFNDDRMVLIIQNLDSIDLELFVHQCYNVMYSEFPGCPGEDCRILRSKARVYPQDGNDVARLVREVL